MLVSQAAMTTPELDSSASLNQSDTNFRRVWRQRLITGLRELAWTPLLPPLLFSLTLSGLLLCDRLVAQSLPGTDPLTAQGDLAAQMVQGIDRFLTTETAAAVARRETHWAPDFSSREAYEDSLASNRARLRHLVGVVDAKPKPRMDGFVLDATTERASLVASTEAYEIHAVRWPVLPGVNGEGLIFEPKTEPKANVIALPDADWSPEMLAGLAPGVPESSQFARRLAENGCRVLVPVLIDRKDTWSGHPGIRYTNQPHREFIYRMAYELGRHIIGYEVQKVLAAIDWFDRERPRKPLGVIGYGEGGLLAFFSAAVDTRIDATVVSGYFGASGETWRQPIYRNVWGHLSEFGDEGLAKLVAPKTLVVEASDAPKVNGPPAESEQRKGAAPGVIETPAVASVLKTESRVRPTFSRLDAGGRFSVLVSAGTRFPPGGDEALNLFLQGLGVEGGLRPAESPPAKNSVAENSVAENLVKDQRPDFEPGPRLRRQFDELVGHTQQLLRQSEFTRRDFWNKADASSAENWETSTESYKTYFWEEVIGRFPDPTEPLRPRSRLIYETPQWKGYEVALPVWPDVFAYGILLVPKDLQPGERRPVVVCQHGLEGRPQDVVDPESDSRYYHRYGARLADRGFIVFAPQNPYIGHDEFRVLQRKANPIKKSIFSVIIGQHQRILEWLKSLPYVDSRRIGFYGLSYGGKTAMRVPSVLDDYALSICSADFNEWIWKNASSTDRHSYVFTGEYEMFEFDLGNTFNYSEMASLIAPRPFMVERGHHDGVAPDEWVAYEFAKVRRQYTALSIADRAEIEFFDGPHTIHGVGTFEFLHRHLDWPEPDD